MTLVVPPSSGAAADGPASPIGDVPAERLPAGCHASAGDEVVTAAVGRLAPEFSGRVGPHLVVRVVRNARQELGGSPVGAMPELVERLARIRLDRHIA